MYSEISFDDPKYFSKVNAEKGEDESDFPRLIFKSDQSKSGYPLYKIVFKKGPYDEEPMFYFTRKAGAASQWESSIQPYELEMRVTDFMHSTLEKLNKKQKPGRKVMSLSSQEEISEEEFSEGLEMFRYYWKEKGDVTRWTGWEKFKPVLEERRPDIYLIFDNYLKAERALVVAMKHLR